MPLPIRVSPLEISRGEHFCIHRLEPIRSLRLEGRDYTDHRERDQPADPNTAQ